MDEGGERLGKKGRKAGGRRDGRNWGKMAKSKYGENARFQMNEDKSFVICSGSIKEKNFSYIKLFVFDIKESKVIYEPSSRIRKFGWIDNKQIELYKVVGMPSADNPEGKIIYNVTTKEEVTPKSN